MSRHGDLLGRIAQARAQMLMRGFDPLALEIGRSTVRELVPWMAGQDDLPSGAPEEILGMGFTIRDDMEGFSVRPAEG